MRSLRGEALTTTSANAQQAADQYMTVQQLAQRLRVTPDYLYSDVLGQPDGIPGIRLGKGAVLGGASIQVMSRSGKSASAGLMIRRRL